MKSLRLLLLLLLLGLLPLGALAAPEFTALRVSPPNEDGSQTYSVTLQVLGFMTAMTFLPLALMMMTSFARIIIVLAILRQALGTMSTPSNQILLGLSLFLTVFIMMPVFDRAYEQGLKPYMDEEVSLQQALETGSQPFREFMMAQTRDTDISLFAEISGAGELDTPDKVPFTLLMPAFLTSELKTAFQIGFLIMIPFLVIDLVVASLLMSMGMMMLSPMIISLPFKIMLFVLIDGWSLVMGTLATSFYV